MTWEKKEFESITKAFLWVEASAIDKPGEIVHRESLFQELKWLVLNIPDGLIGSVQAIGYSDHIGGPITEKYLAYRYGSI
jgi:hypothetical protein